MQSCCGKAKQRLGIVGDPSARAAALSEASGSDWTSDPYKVRVAAMGACAVHAARGADEYALPRMHGLPCLASHSAREGESERVAPRRGGPRDQREPEDAWQSESGRRVARACTERVRSGCARERENELIFQRQPTQRPRTNTHPVG